MGWVGNLLGDPAEGVKQGTDQPHCQLDCAKMLLSYCLKGSCYKTTAVATTQQQLLQDSSTGATRQLCIPLLLSKLKT